MAFVKRANAIRVYISDDPDQFPVIEFDGLSFKLTDRAVVANKTGADTYWKKALEFDGYGDRGNLINARLADDSGVAGWFLQTNRLDIQVAWWNINSDQSVATEEVLLRVKRLLEDVADAFGLRRPVFQSPTYTLFPSRLSVAVDPR